MNPEPTEMGPERRDRGLLPITEERPAALVGEDLALEAARGAFARDRGRRRLPQRGRAIRSEEPLHAQAVGLRHARRGEDRQLGIGLRDLYPGPALLKKRDITL
ncbi:hypothetical protein [Streptomyces sp. NPDC007905]|uniref:hypothetical protein n=1 Tax=Streptomyces sp. NPDC007905 TaxID=3364788 RepID=UPI0036E991C3